MDTVGHETKRASDADGRERADDTRPLHPIAERRWAEVLHSLETIQGREKPIRTEAVSALIEPRSVTPVLWGPLAS